MNLQNRAGLSLLGHCYYQIQSYDQACSVYVRLSHLFPDVPDYQVSLAQSLYNAGHYEDALQATILRGNGKLDLETEQKVKLSFPGYSGIRMYIYIALGCKQIKFVNQGHKAQSCHPLLSRRHRGCKIHSG
jgi:tetratricopeptide (TPR) repeat protein